MTEPGSTLPRWLGFAGLLPFLGLTAWIGLASHETAQSALAFVLYSALILSFLGGIRWGLSVQGPQPAIHFIVAVSLSLWGWTALLMPALPWQLAGLGLGHLVALLADVWLPPSAQPAWLRRLRMQLSIVAIGCHLVLIALI